MEIPYNRLYNRSVERVILASLIFQPELIEETGGEIVNSDFYIPFYREVFSVLHHLDKRKSIINEDLIKEELERRDKYNEEEFFNIFLESPIANIGYHTKELKDRSVKRQLLQLAKQIEDSIFEQDMDSSEVLSTIEGSLFKITQNGFSKGFRDSPEIVDSTTEYIEEMSQRESSDLIGLDTGFAHLNKMTTGFNPGELIIVAARPAMGKCLSRGTTVVSYDGTPVKVEDVKVGDLLMGDDSTPRKVLSLARGREKMYWIRQNKGVDYRVNESHILSLKRSRNEGKHKRGNVLNISVKEYLQKSNKFKSNYKGYKVAVEFPEKPITIEPYFLGVWLGDGNSNSAQITITDGEVHEYLKTLSKELEIDLKIGFLNRNPKHTRYKLHKNSGGKDSILQTGLQNLHLINNKHIPHNYLTNNTENRLQLLAGLIDSDGYYDRQANGYEITQKDEKLAKQIKYLCDSLGFRTSLKKKVGQIKSLGFKGEYYRVRFFGDIDRIPVKIPRKKARKWDINRSWNQTGIRVEEDIVDDYYGFTLDGNSLFLLEDMTVTHNTAFALNLVHQVLMTNRGVAFFSLEMPAEQLMMRLLSINTRIPLQEIRTGHLSMDSDWNLLHRSLQDFKGRKLFVDDDGNLNINQLRTKLRKLKSKHNDVDMAVIDYLQIMSGAGSKDRQMEVSEISRGLKLLARELEIPIIALSQLNRSLESRNDKRPIMSDIRESGSIEQDADIILFVYRDDVYRLKAEREREKEAKSKGQKFDSEYEEKSEELAEIIIGKQRNGPTGVVKLNFQKQFTRFVNFEDLSSGFEEEASVRTSVNMDNFDDIDMPVI